MTIRVVVADDQGMVRSGFSTLLNAQPDIEVIGEAVNGQDAVDSAEQTVKTHVSRVLMKLGPHDRAQAVVFAYESGLVRPGE